MNVVWCAGDVQLRQPHHCLLRKVCRLFFGIAGEGFVANSTHDMRLFANIIYRAAHGFAIDGQTFIGLCILSAPVSQRLVKRIRLYANQDINTPTLMIA